MALLPQLLHSPSMLFHRCRQSQQHHHVQQQQPLLFTKNHPRTSKTTNNHDHHKSKNMIFRCLSESSGGGGDNSSNDAVVELPLFPLPLVLFPGAVLPLQIFEFRYRIMMQTLLQTDLRFGVVFSGDGGQLASVGCVGEVVKHERLSDDRFLLVCKGQERFRVSRILRSLPYLVAAVSWLEDRPSAPSSSSDHHHGDVEGLAREAEGYMRDVIRISNRLSGKKEDDEGAMDLRRSLYPTPFSFFVGSTFEGAPREQQALLEMEDTAARLRRERDTLRSTLNYLTAASAVKDAFPDDSSSSPPPSDQSSSSSSS